MALGWRIPFFDFEFLFRAKVPETRESGPFPQCFIYDHIQGLRQYLGQQGLQIDLNNPISWPEPNENVVVVASPALMRALDSGSAVWVALCSTFPCLPLQLESGLSESRVRQKYWSAIATAISEHCGIAIPQKRKDLLLVGSREAILQLLGQIRIAARVQHSQLTDSQPRINIIPMKLQNNSSQPRDKSMPKIHPQQGDLSKNTSEDVSLTKQFQRAAQTPPPISRNPFKSTITPVPQLERNSQLEMTNKLLRHEEAHSTPDLVNPLVNMIASQALTVQQLQWEVMNFPELIHQQQDAFWRNFSSFHREQKNDLEEVRKKFGTLLLETETRQRRLIVEEEEEGKEILSEAAEAFSLVLAQTKTLARQKRSEMRDKLRKAKEKFWSQDVGASENQAWEDDLGGIIRVVDETHHFPAAVSSEGRTGTALPQENLQHATSIDKRNVETNTVNDSSKETHQTRRQTSRECRSHDTEIIPMDRLLLQAKTVHLLEPPSLWDYLQVHRKPVAPSPSCLVSQVGLNTQTLLLKSPAALCDKYIRRRLSAPATYPKFENLVNRLVVSLRTKRALFSPAASEPDQQQICHSRPMITPIPGERWASNVENDEVNNRAAQFLVGFLQMRWFIRKRLRLKASTALKTRCQRCEPFIDALTDRLQGVSIFDLPVAVIQRYTSHICENCATSCKIPAEYCCTQIDNLVFQFEDQRRREVRSKFPLRWGHPSPLPSRIDFDNRSLQSPKGSELERGSTQDRESSRSSLSNKQWELNDSIQQGATASAEPRGYYSFSPDFELTDHDLYVLVVQRFLRFRRSALRYRLKLHRHLSFLKKRLTTTVCVLQRLARVAILRKIEAKKPKLRSDRFDTICRHCGPILNMLRRRITFLFPAVLTADLQQSWKSLCCFTCRDVMIPALLDSVIQENCSARLLQTFWRWVTYWRHNKSRVFRQYLPVPGESTSNWVSAIFFPGEHKCPRCGPVLNALYQRMPWLRNSGNIQHYGKYACRDRAVCREMYKFLVSGWKQYLRFATFLTNRLRWLLLKKHLLVAPIPIFLFVHPSESGRGQRRKVRGVRIAKDAENLGDFELANALTIAEATMTKSLVGPTTPAMCRACFPILSSLFAHVWHLHTEYKVQLSTKKINNYAVLLCDECIEAIRLTLITYVQNCAKLLFLRDLWRFRLYWRKLRILKAQRFKPIKHFLRFGSHDSKDAFPKILEYTCCRCRPFISLLRELSYRGTIFAPLRKIAGVDPSLVAPGDDSVPMLRYGMLLRLINCMCPQCQIGPGQVLCRRTLQELWIASLRKIYFLFRCFISNRTDEIQRERWTRKDASKMRLTPQQRVHLTPSTTSQWSTPNSIWTARRPTPFDSRPSSTKSSLSTGPQDMNFSIHSGSRSSFEPKRESDTLEKLPPAVEQVAQGFLAKYRYLRRRLLTQFDNLLQEGVQDPLDAISMEKEVGLPRLTFRFGPVVSRIPLQVATANSRAGKFCPEGCSIIAELYLHHCSFFEHLIMQPSETPRVRRVPHCVTPRRRWGYLCALCETCQGLLRLTIEADISLCSCAQLAIDRLRWIKYRRHIKFTGPTRGQCVRCTPMWKNFRERTSFEVKLVSQPPEEVFSSHTFWSSPLPADLLTESLYRARATRDLVIAICSKKSTAQQRFGHYWHWLCPRCKPACSASIQGHEQLIQEIRRSISHQKEPEM